MKPAFKLSSDGVRYAAVAIPGLLGLVVIGRTAGIYVGTDPLALGIVLVMGVGFALGFVELFARLWRAASIDAETRALPVPATDEAVDAASAGLKAFLRSRIEHAGTPPVRESFTPYLVGLMVMLGLLGTLLGLFETLRGAGLALTESANVDALRTGLSGPMRGLTRSFGCSAAGVMASAMLGLAAVFVRRAEARALAVVHAYANGPLRGLSPLRRQLDALDQLAVQGEALPLAASSLAKAAGTLDTLAARWESAHAAAVESQRKAVVEAVSRLGDDLGKAAAQAAKGMHDTVAPLIKQSVAQTGEAAARHMNAVLEALERDIKGRREADDATRKALREELSSLRQWVEQDAGARAVEAQKRLDLVDGAMRRYADDQAQVLTMHREQATAHVAAIAAAARELNTQLSEDAAARRGEATTLLGDLAQRMEQTAKEHASQSRNELEAVAKLGERFIQEAVQRETTLSARWEGLSQSYAAQSREGLDAMARLGELFMQEAQSREASLATRWESLAQSHAAQSQQELEAVAQLGERFLQEAQARETALSARWERLAKVAEDSDLARNEQTERVVKQLDESLGLTAMRIDEVLSQRSAADAEQAERAKTAFEALTAGAQGLEHVLASLQAHQTGHAKLLSEELNTHAQNLGKGLESTTALVHEAATVLKANSVEMAAVAEMFAASVERQREAAKTWIESLGEIEGAVERAGRGAAADALGDQLASTQEVFARQLQFQRELFEQLRTLRVSPAASADHGQHTEQADVSA